MTSKREYLKSRIRQTISNLPDDELIRILRADLGNYTPFALKVAHEELAKRNRFETALRHTNGESIRQPEPIGNALTELSEAHPATGKEDLMGEHSGGCYIELWQGKNFEGEYIRIGGPAECPVLRSASIDWGDCISSLRIGPNAFALVYEGRDFKGNAISLGPNQEVADLHSLRFDNEIDSIKIFERSRVDDGGRVKRRRESK